MRLDIARCRQKPQEGGVDGGCGGTGRDVDGVGHRGCGFTCDDDIHQGWWWWFRVGFVMMDALRRRQALETREHDGEEGAQGG